MTPDTRTTENPEHDYDPSCACRDCHLEAEAEDATWD